MAAISMQAIAANPACSRYQPGHYVRVDDDPKVRKLDGLGLLRQILATDVRNLKGVAYVVPWGLIETSQGVYDFSRLDQALAITKAKGKYLVLKWLDRTFWTTCNSNFVPSYVKRTATTYTGTGFNTTKWCSANIWETETMNHEIRVLKAIANRYKNDPYFLGINAMEEPNIDVPQLKTTSAVLQLYKQARRRNAEVHAVAPNLMTIQGFNWPANRDVRNFDGLVQGLHDLKGGGVVSWPDTRPEKATSWSWYQIARDNKDKLFIFPEFQVTYFYDVGDIATWEKVYNFATQDIGAHAVLWGATNRINGKWEGIKYFTSVVVPLMNKYPKVTTKGCPWVE
jgi:hypothetical protein